jgi:hypothetical protein
MAYIVSLAHFAALHQSVVPQWELHPRDAEIEEREDIWVIEARHTSLDSGLSINLMVFLTREVPPNSGCVRPRVQVLAASPCYSDNAERLHLILPPEELTMLEREINRDTKSCMAPLNADLRFPVPIPLNRYTMPMAA